MTYNYKCCKKYNNQDNIISSFKSFKRHFNKINAHICMKKLCKFKERGRSV